MAKGKGKKGGGSKSSTEMIVYRGPIQAPVNSQPQVMRTTLRNRYNGTSNGAGIMELWDATSQATALPEFGNFAPEWREYRVLGMRHEYRPLYDKGGFNGSALKLGLGAAASYHGPVPPFQGAVTTSTDLALWQYGSCKPWHVSDVCIIEWRMADVEEAQFQSTSTNSQVGGIYTLVSNLQNNTQYGVVYMTWLLEFKGRV